MKAFVLIKVRAGEAPEVVENLRWSKASSSPYDPRTIRRHRRHRNCRCREARRDHGQEDTADPWRGADTDLPGG